MEWCGRTTSSFAKFPAECSCIWAECRREHIRNADKESAQTEASNRGLQPDEQSVLQVQGDLVAFVKEALEIIHRASEGQAMRQWTIDENPKESWLRGFDFLELNQWILDISDDEAWTDVDYFSHSWGGIRVKKLIPRTNMRSARQALHVGGMAGDQRHNQHVQERDPWKMKLGECVMPEQAEEEHSARFAWQMAVAICRETARRLQFRLGILRSPAYSHWVKTTGLGG